CRAPARSSQRAQRVRPSWRRGRAVRCRDLCPRRAGRCAGTAARNGGLSVMLIPRRTKHRKQHHPTRSGMAKGGTDLAFGDYGIQALAPAYVTNRQIEAARIAMTRYMKRGGKVFINIYPDRPLTKKPAEVRMGSGKGSVEWWVANIK